MSGLGLVLIGISAVFHVTAQALIKGATDKRAFAWLMMGVCAAAGAPLLFLSTAGPVAPVGFAFVLTSGVLEALYYTVLTKAYSLGDFSTVYPISRGSAPLFVLLWAAVFLGERPSAMGFLGICIVIAGISLAGSPLPSFRSGSVPWALGTGLVISLYTTVDKAGMEYFDPAVYLHLVFVCAWICMAPTFVGIGRFRPVIEEVTKYDDRDGGRSIDYKACARVALCASFIFAAYTLVLAALKLNPAGYVSATREISVVIAAWIGVRRFGEKGGRLRIAAAMLVVVGVAVIALAR